MKTIWLVDDLSSSASLLQDALTTCGSDASLVYFSGFEEYHTALQLLKASPDLIPDALFIDFYLNDGYTGSDVLRTGKEFLPGTTTFVAFSSTPNKNQQLLKEGAHTAIPKTSSKKVQAHLQDLLA